MLVSETTMISLYHRFEGVEEEHRDVWEGKKGLDGL